MYIFAAAIRQRAYSMRFFGLPGWQAAWDMRAGRVLFGIFN
ncbi:hypothetical protein [Undibacterium parvum]|nr:hypothetical protein [Undibacterium parvum]MCX7219163.1 hypothetical protein [Burkholderiales bacterium]